MKVSFLFFLMLAVSVPSFGADSICEDLESVNKKTESCDDNEYISEAAVQCLMNLEKAIKAETGSAEAALEAMNAMGRQTQAGRQHNSMLDYKLSRDVLDGLIRMAKASQEETADFYDAVIWPEDFDEPEVTGPDFDAFLNSDPCYKDNRDVISNVLADFDTYIAQLEEARDAAVQLENVSKGRTGNMNSMTAGPVKAAGKRNPASIPKKNFKRRLSDVSGTEELPQKH